MPETKVLVFYKPRGCRKPKVQGSGRIPNTILDAVLWAKRDHCNAVYIVDCRTADHGRFLIKDLRKTPKWFAEKFSCMDCGYPNIYIIGRSEGKIVGRSEDSTARRCAEHYDSIFGNLRPDEPVPAVAFRSVAVKS